MLPAGHGMEDFKNGTQSSILHFDYGIYKKIFVKNQVGKGVVVVLPDPSEG